MTATTEDVREVHTAVATFLRAHEDALRRGAADPVRAAAAARALAEGLDGDLRVTLDDVNARLGVAAFTGAPDADEVAAWALGDPATRLRWAAHAVAMTRRQLAAALVGLEDAYGRVDAGLRAATGLEDLAADLARLHGGRERVRAGLAALRENLDAWARAAFVVLGGTPDRMPEAPPPLEYVWRARERLALHEVDAGVALLERALDAAGVSGFDAALAVVRDHPEGLPRLLDAAEAAIKRRR